jgi:glutaredoxin 3
MIYIFGKAGCPFTEAARADYARRQVKFEYVDVKADPAGLQKMLKHSKGGREVPVIVEDNKVTIGFGGT